MADPLAEQLLHFTNADPNRTPSFTVFPPGDYFFSSGTTDSCGSGVTADNANLKCASINGAFAWDHGYYAPQIDITWLGMVGPGVRKGHGEERDDDDAAAIQFSDHTDIRPTMLTLLGLQDDYQHDGRVLFEALLPSAIPHSLRAHHETLLGLARTYKQINAPFGQLSLDSLPISTEALASNAPGDSVYTNLEAKIADWTSRRDALASDMKAALEAAAFQGQSINEQQAKKLIDKGKALIKEVSACAANIPVCAQ